MLGIVQHEQTTELGQKQTIPEHSEAQHMAPLYT